MGVFMRYEKLKDKINKMLEDYKQVTRGKAEVFYELWKDEG